MKFDVEFWWNYLKDMLDRAKDIEGLDLGKKYIADASKGKSMQEVDGLIIKGMIEGMGLVVSTYLVDVIAKEEVRNKTKWYVA